MKLLFLFCFLESKASIPNHCSCKTSWSKHLVGTELKCFKFIGRIKIKDAKSACEKIGSTLPFPETFQENLDLLKMGSKCIVVTDEIIVDGKKPTPGQSYPNFPWLTLGYDPTQSQSKSAKQSFSNWIAATNVSSVEYASLYNMPQSPKAHGKWRSFSGLTDSWTVCQLECHLSNTTLTSPVRISTLTYLSTTVQTSNLSPTYASQNNLIELRRMVDLHTKIYVDRTLRQLTNFNDNILKEKIVKFNLTSDHGQPELENNEKIFKSTMNTLFNMLLTSSKNKRTLNTSSSIIKMLAALVKGGCST